MSETKSYKLNFPYFDSTEVEAVERVLKSGWVSGQGPETLKLEQEFAQYIGVKHAVCVNNCTAALHLALLAAGVGEGDQVLVPDYTFPATAHAVLYCRATPVFVDIDPRTFNIDPARILEKVTPRTKVILVVHAFGLCADMKRIGEIAKDRGLFVIEDGACAIGSKYQQQLAGNFGDIACFSFHGRKNITCGEGGMITTNNAEHSSYVRKLTCFGIDSAYNRAAIPVFKDLGYNYKLSDIQAAIVRVQLGRIEQFLNQKNTLAEHYRSALNALPGVTTPFVPEGYYHAYQSYIILLDTRYDRNRVIQLLAAHKIEAKIGTYALHQQPVYQPYIELGPISFPHATRISEQAIAMPLFYTMTKQDVQQIAASLREVLPHATQ